MSRKELSMAKCATPEDAKKAINSPEDKTQGKSYAKGGMAARGCGAAIKGKKLTRNG